MLIGIDCRAMKGRGGIAHYTYNLVKNLLSEDKKNHYVLFFDYKINPRWQKIFEQKNCSVRYFPVRKFKILPLVYAHLLCGHYLNQQKLDLFHSPFLSFPLFYKGRLCVTAHDLVIYQHPEWFPGRQWFSKKIIVPRALQRAKKIIAVSYSTAREIRRLFKVQAGKIAVIYEAGLEGYKSSRTAEEGREILFVGVLEPRKNLVRLLKAFAWYCQRFPQAKENLRIVGGEGWIFESIYITVEKLKLKERVLFSGYVSEKEKAQLFKQAKLFVYPSLHEGFGLPVLEAMSLGAPVLCSKAGALPEIGGNAAFYIDPHSVVSIYQGLVKMLRNPKWRAVLRQRGIKQAQKFSWKKCAQETLAVYREILETKNEPPKKCNFFGGTP